tara:strand:+ start:173 stop:3001 length:2829 start_codon:yes stop_codon:yes gene_type:complete
MAKNIKLFLFLYLLILSPIPATAQIATVGEDLLYGVKSTSGTTQDWGTINPTNGAFTSITQISPTNLGWPLGDIGSQPDPINGYVYTRQTNSGTNDILAIKKSDGSTKWLGLTANDLVVGYDTKNNKLIYRNSSSANILKTYDINEGTTDTISSSFASGVSSWQAGGIGAVNSFGRTAFQLKPDTTSKLYKINLDDGTETTIDINAYITTIAWDSKKQKLYGVYDSDGISGYRIAEINTDDGSLRNVSAVNSISGMSNYVQMIAPNDQRYYVNENGGVIRAISLSDGTSLGTFTAPLRLMPVGAIPMGANDTSLQTVAFDINDPDSEVIKLGSNTVIYTGTNSSSGGVDVEAGTLKVSGSDNLGSGEVSLEGGELEISTNTTLTNAISSSSDDSTIDTSSNSVTASGTLSGSKEINKTGTGTLTLTGTLNNTGGIDVKSGTLIANGTGVTPVTVTSGTLQGSGTIGNLTSSSFVAPGNSIGTLNVAGNVTLNSGSILVIEVNSDGTSDKIIATGNANLGGVLRISPEAGTYNASTEYTFLTASNVSGTFSNVVLLSCSGGDTISTTYGASSVKVTLSSCTIKSTNANIIKSYINDLSANASGDLSSAITELNTLSGATYDAAINQLDHDMTGAVTFVGQQQISKINSIIEKQLNTLEEKKDHPEKTEQKNSWGQAYGVSGKKKTSSDKGINGYEYQFSGIILGSDFLVGKDIYGATASIIETDITNNNNEGKSEYTSIALTGYNSAYLQSGNKLNTKLSFVTNLVKSKRYLNFGSISRTASAKYKTYGLDIGLNFAVKPFNTVGGNLNTNLNTGLTYNYQSGFTETGADSLNLKVNSKGAGILRAGIDQAYTFNNKIQSLSPFVNWGVNISQQLNSPSSVQALQNQQSFTITDNKRNNIIGQVGFGIMKEFSNGSEFNFSATQKFSGGLNETSAMLKYIKTF